jgi:hypothetical protein
MPNLAYPLLNGVPQMPVRTASPLGLQHQARSIGESAPQVIYRIARLKRDADRNSTVPREISQPKSSSSKSVRGQERGRAAPMQAPGLVGPAAA